MNRTVETTDHPAGTGMDHHGKTSNRPGKTMDRSDNTVPKFLIHENDDYSDDDHSDDSNGDGSVTDIDDMATPANRQHVVHQDYIARQRYSNVLPPPPGAPKLVDIPMASLMAYCHPSYGSRMARSEPLNIVADGFGGMPIDLVGMPGVMDGDESSIQSPLVQPPVHPRDRALLRPLKSLGQPKTEDSGVSFLRRTQYTAEDHARRVAETGSRKTPLANVRRRKPTADAEKEAPINILRDVVKGFDIAYPEDAYKGPDTMDNIRGAEPTRAELEAWNNPVHPSKPNLKMVDFYPIVPDLDAFTDDGGYMVTKFSGMPTDVTEHHDKRMDSALLYAQAQSSQEQIADYQTKLAAHETDPVRNPMPAAPSTNFKLFLPHDETTATNVKKMMDPDNPNSDDPNLYTYNTKGGRDNDSFRYDWVRDYETGATIQNADMYDMVALTLGDKAQASYFPINSQVHLKPKRAQFLAQAGLGGAGALEDDEQDKIDRVDFTVRTFNEDERAQRVDRRATVEEVVDE